MKKIIAIALLSLLAACGDGTVEKLDGNYVSDWHTWTFKFKPDGTVDFSSPTKKLSENKYKIDGNKIIIEGNPFPFSLKENGSIDGGSTYGILVKK